MKYYLLSTSTNKKEIGVYFQTEGLPTGYTSKWYDEPRSMTMLNNSSLPSFTPDLKWQLRSKAKLTDIISAGNITAEGFLMSEKAKSIFQKHVLTEHKFHNSILITRNKPVDYYYLHLVYRNFQDIDFKTSSFCVTDLFRIKKDDIGISSYDDLIDKQKTLEFGKLISAETINVKNNSFDLFLFPLIHNDIFVSEKLLNELISNGVTGFNAKEQNLLFDN